jgi:hypothetical protein
MQDVGVQVCAVEPGNYNSQIMHNAAVRMGITSRVNERPNEPQAQRTIRKQIAQLVELNEGQAYTYDRAALIKMLDEALAESRPRTP